MPETIVSRRNEAIQTARNILEQYSKFAIIDTETTGVGRSAEALELAVVSTEGETLFSGYFQPKGEISQHSIAIHGLDAKTLKAKGAVNYGDVHDDVIKVLDGRVVIGYQVSYDVNVLEYTAGLWGLDSPVTGGSLCALSLRRRFEPDLESHKLGGNHTALGDCKELLKLLHRIAEAKVVDDPDAVSIGTRDEVIEVHQQLETLSKQRLAIAKQEAILKEQLAGYFLNEEVESINLGDGRKLWLVPGYKEVKPKVDVADLPEHYTELTVSRKSLNAEFKSTGELNSDLFDYQESFTVRAKKI